MKAFVVHEAHKCELVDIPIPIIKSDEVLVKIKAASLCHSDLDIIDGLRVHAIKLPIVLGHEFCGVIEELGSDVVGFEKGQLVACECIVWCGECRFCKKGETSSCENFDEIGTCRNGGFAEYVAVPAKMVHSIKNLNSDETSNIEPAGNGYHAAQKAQINEGDSVVIIGPGPIGLYAMQFAALHNPSKLIMVGTNNHRLDVAKKLGATHVVNIREQDPYEEIMKISEGKGVDRVLQCAPTVSAVELGLKILGKGGIMAIEGHVSEPVPVNFGMFLEIPVEAIIGVCGVTHQNYIDTIRHAEAGKINFSEVITHKFNLDDIEEAIELIRNKKAIKIVIHP